TDDSEIETFADGLEEDIATGLSRFSYLFVVARKSTRRYRGEATDVRQVGEELGARFVMEGGIRKAGSTIRINVQIVDTETGTHLWAETFDRDLDETAIFAIQDDITDRVVATVADPYGVVARSMAIPTAAMEPEEMTAYQAVLRYFLYQQRLSQEDHLIAREALERAVEIEPGYPDAWSCLTLVVLDEDRHDFNRRPDALDRALSTARRGVEADPASSFAHYALATVYFYRRDLGSFRANAEKAIKLNRRNGNVVAMLGVLYGYSGDWKRGVELTTEAMELNPHHPGWYRFTTFFDHYLKGDYDEALKVAQKINMPGYFAAHMAELLAHKRLGNTAAAENAAREMLHAYPAEDMSGYGRHAEMWFYSQPDLLNQVISDLRSIGVEVDTPGGEVHTPVPAPSVSAPAASPISADTETQQVAIAVLPFADMSPEKDQDYFCEGMAEEIMNALVRIEGIRVASRTSAFRARQEGHGLAEIARLLSVSHILEGSVRTAGRRLRVTAQLTDVVSGHQLWSERFDRELQDVFAVQDEIAAGVVEAVEARLAPGARIIPARPQACNLEAYRSYLLGQHLRYAKEDHGGAVRAFQEAIRLDPTHAPSWTGLAESLALSAHMSLIPSHEACAGARKALATALELQGESADGLHGEGFVAFIERRWEDLEAAVRRAIELQPSHVPSLGLLGMCLSLHQKPDEAEPFFERAREIDPLASFPYMLTALGLLTARRPQEAHPYAEQALTFEKEDASALFCSSLANVALGHFDEGISAAEHGVAVSHRGADFLGLLGWALATAGRKDEARTLLEELRARPATAPPIVSEGWLLGALGEIDAAFEVLVRAENENQLWLYYTGLPGFDSLRGDPRFGGLLERLGLPSEGA
ncbi:MAG: tetratricopeptide repeat protein, partial [Acidimicrobiia bacterium]|nr:tetratricopeptide repeat protein [Acidimicrobiia bacterium]